MLKIRLMTSIQVIIMMGALLLASCLEYVGIYPVLVLLTGHPFVGYWRSDQVHDEVFATVKKVPATVPARAP